MERFKAGKKIRALKFEPQALEGRKAKLEAAVKQT